MNFPSEEMMAKRKITPPDEHACEHWECDQTREQEENRHPSFSAWCVPEVTQLSSRSTLRRFHPARSSNFIMCRTDDE